MGLLNYVRDNNEVSILEIFNKYRGNDCVELRIESTQGDVMHMEIATRVDARNPKFNAIVSTVLIKNLTEHLIVGTGKL